MSISSKVVSCPRKGIQPSKEEGKPQHSVFFCHPNAKQNDNSPPSRRIPLAILCPLLGDPLQAPSTREQQHRQRVSS